MDALERYIHYKHNPWDFLMDCVFTLDQVDKVNPIKTLPNRDYAQIYCKIWQTFPRLAVPKSRRMTMSWFTIALYLHDAMFNTGRYNAFVSKKEDDADELVKRAIFILEHIPKDKIPPEFVPHFETKYCVLDFPDQQSRIEGFPQGADQLRQFTFSGIFGDECAFWDHAKEFYSASFPTIEGGGRMTLVSSPAPGFFKKLCFDSLDTPEDINVEDMQVDYENIMQGVRIWGNKQNKFKVFEVHYSADPKKRAPEFKESIKSSMPLMEYLREYELHWDTFAGFPVYPEFSRMHVTNEKPSVMHGLPMLVGIDFGLTPAAIIAQYQEDRLMVFEELVEINMGSDRFAEKLAIHIKLNYPSHDSLRDNWRCFIDPAGLQRNQKDETACALSLSSKGFVPIPGPILFEERRQGVVKFLRGMTSKGPELQVYERACPMLTKGFEGGYHYPEKFVDQEPGKPRPLKNGYSHPHDGFQYLCCGIRDIISRVSKQVPRPRYSARQDQQKTRLTYGRN